MSWLNAATLAIFDCLSIEAALSDCSPRQGRLNSKPTDAPKPGPRKLTQLLLDLVAE